MVYLNHFGAWLPERVVNNEEMGALLECDPAWILGVSGIEERRFGSEQDTVVSMGTAAAERSLESAGIAASEIGYLICSSGTADRRFPGPAVEIAHRLGCNEIPALDVPVASAGSLVAMDLARSLAPRYGKVLVVASEKMSAVALTQPVERGTSMLFGDGAGACLVSETPGPLGVVDSLLASAGQFANDLALPFGAPLSMSGRSVILQASRKIPRAVEALLERNALAPKDIVAYVMHQANLNLMHKVAAALKVDESRFFANIARYANTSSASLLIAATEWLAGAKPEPGEHVVFTGFGAGFQWGALLLRAA